MSVAVLVFCILRIQIPMPLLRSTVQSWYCTVPRTTSVSYSCKPNIVHACNNRFTILFCSGAVCFLDITVPVQHGKRLMESYVNSMASASCVMAVQTLEAGDAYNGVSHDCRHTESLTGNEFSRHISFVEAQSVGHNWVFTSREWLAVVPTFIDRFSSSIINIWSYL